MSRFITSDFGGTISAVAAIGFAWFGEGALSTVIALLLVANPVASLVLTIKRLRRK